ELVGFRYDELVDRKSRDPCGSPEVRELLRRRESCARLGRRALSGARLPGVHREGPQHSRGDHVAEIGIGGGGAERTLPPPRPPPARRPAPRGLAVSASTSECSAGEKKSELPLTMPVISPSGPVSSRPSRRPAERKSSSNSTKPPGSSQRPPPRVPPARRPRR